MTKKEDLQQEILEKVRPGTKPSDLRKPKRSKSADDINPNPSPNNNPPNHLLQDQLSEKQKQIESLRKNLETTNNELKETKEQLDNSLFARIEAVKQFGQIYDKLQQVRQELDATVEEASSEITSSDNQVSQLRTKLRTASQQINQLQQELKFEKIKKTTYPNNPNNLTDNFPNLNYLQLACYALIAIWFFLLLNNNERYNKWPKN